MTCWRDYPHGDAWSSIKTLLVNMSFHLVCLPPYIPPSVVVSLHRFSLSFFVCFLIECHKHDNENSSVDIVIHNDPCRDQGKTIVMDIMEKSYKLSKEELDDLHSSNYRFEKHRYTETERGKPVIRIHDRMDERIEKHKDVSTYSMRDHNPPHTPHGAHVVV